MSLLLLFGAGVTNPAGPVANIALGAPAGATIGGFLAGPVANVALGSPVGALVLVLSAAVANIALGAPVGTLTVPHPTRPPFSVVLRASANSVRTIGPNRVVIRPSPQGVS